ncbi:YggT family protein [Alicyclobacillus acidiphilus]|uniref:YggT family protein n=1 Tax=Alicyclobacillus acidiphilus TaxID=182455 RepID=UPI00082C47C4|nr:YggT family protein [Alicyclobacillus acidiphilus]
MAEFAEGLFSAYWYLLLIVALIRIVPDLSSNAVGQLLLRLTDPYLYIFRRYIPPLPIGQISLDISWIVGVGVFYVIETAVSSAFAQLLTAAR